MVASLDPLGYLPGQSPPRRNVLATHIPAGRTGFPGSDQPFCLRVKVQTLGVAQVGELRPLADQVDDALKAG